MKAGRRTTSRHNRKKGGRTLKGLLFVALCLGLAAGVYIVLHSAFFEVREVVFRGNRHLSKEELRTIMKVSERDCLLKLSLRRLAGRLSDSPWVKAVSVRKEYPRRLVVLVKEAEPAALLDRKGALYLIEGDGQVLEKLRGESVPFLPVIVGGKAEGGDAFAEALRLARAVKATGLAAERNRIEITGVAGGPENLTLKVDGLVVKIGNGQYEKKLSRLFELMGEIHRRWERTEYVDLRFANRVVVKPVAGGAR